MALVCGSHTYHPPHVPFDVKGLEQGAPDTFADWKLPLRASGDGSAPSVDCAMNPRRLLGTSVLDTPMRSDFSRFECCYGSHLQLDQAPVGWRQR